MPDGCVKIGRIPSAAFGAYSSSSGGPYRVT